uniref:S1 motif domain-containing protein n=1 Tax=Macrostomum lignano TaxID=282301 RepID=A0A1I8HF15_9PLAT
CLVSVWCLITPCLCIITHPVYSYEDVKLAAPITGTLLRYCKEGALVRVARNLRGLVPYLHLSDYPAKHQKHRHLEPDTELKCRVLSASAVDRKLILTAKPGLVRSEETPVTRLEQLLPGVLADCFVAKLDSNGILLAFYGAAKAWAPRTQLGLADSDSIEQVYYRGQVLRVRITRPAAGNRLPVASLLLEGKKSVPESQAAKNRSLLYKQLNKAGLGSLVSCRILAKQAGFFRVALITLSNEKDEFNWTNSIEARLPFEHLTDQAAYADALAKFRRIGDIVSPCVIWNLDASVVVSAKPSLVRFAKDGANFPKDFESIQVGDQLYGLAHQFKQYGWFVQLPAGFRGLAPVKALASEHPPFPLKDLFKAGQTVVAKVLEKNAEKQRCLLSLRVRDCARPVEDLDDSLLLLEETIKLLDSGGLCRNRALLPGSLVRVAVSATNAAETDLRFRKFRLLDSSSLEKSIAYKYTCTAAANQLLGADCTPGSRHKALVLSIDPNKRSVNLCLRPDLLNDLAAAQSTVRVADVQPGEAYPAEVLYAGFDYRMVALRLGPNTQQVAFLPARRHWNESYSASNPTVGSRIQVVVQRFVRGGSETDSRIYRLVALQSESAKSEGFRHLAPSAAKSGAALAKRKVTVGEAFAVRVMAITSCQLNVEDLHSRTKGRIFITEVTDSPQQMVSPLSNFSIGQELLARVVGIRSDRFHEDQSHPLGGKRSNLYELSARPSILNRPGNDFSDLFDLPPASVLPPMWLYVHHADPKLRKVSMYASIGRTVLAGDRVAAYVTSTSQFFYRACLPAGRSGQFHILDMDPSRPADIADLLSAAARRYGLPSRFSSRRAPFMLAEVIRVDRSANNCPVHWLRPVSAANANHQQSADTTNSSFLIGYVARHCDRGLAVTFGGLTRTAVVPVPPRARRLFPIGRRVRCSSSRDSGGGGGVNCSDNRHRPRLYRLEEPIPDAAEKPATTKPAATPTATAKTKSRRRRLSSSASVNDDAEDGARRTKTQRLDNGVVLVVHASNEKSSASKSGSYLPLDLADNESVDENEDVDVGESQNSSTASTKQNRRRSGSSSVANNKSEFESLVTREPSNASHWADYARYYVESGELDSARSIIERGLIAVGRLGAGDAADAGRKRLLRSLLLLESRAVAEAGEDPDAMDRLTQATYRACQMQDPGLIQLAVSSLLERGEANKAEAAAAKLRRARPDCPKAWRLQLEVKLRRGRNDDAKRLLFDQALSALPKRHHLGLLSGYAELACRYGRRADGVATFESLIESHPGRPELYLLYGRCLLLGGGGGGGIAAARELLAKAREILPDKSCSQLATLSDLIDNASSSMPTASVEGIPDGSAVVTGDEGLPLME